MIVERKENWGEDTSARTMVFDETNNSGKSKKNLDSSIRFLYIAYKQTQ